MRAIVTDGTGGIEVLRMGEAPDPVPGDGELLVRVRAAGVNRADILQRRGLYPPPAGASPILGLEIAGEVIRAGPACGDWRPGDRVCALLAGGGYAAAAAVPSGTAMPLPEGLSYEEGAAIPEAFLTAHRALFDLGAVAPKETVLVHAGASGVGTAAIQVARAAGASVLATAGSAEKVARCLELGAGAGWNYREGPFAPFVARSTGGRGADVILDFIGGPWLAQNLGGLAPDGRLIVIGLLGGPVAERIDLGLVLSRRLRIIGTALRSLPGPAKARLVGDFRAFGLPRFADGRLKAVIDRVYEWTDAAGAHARMESNRNIGKIVLRIAG